MGRCMTVLILSFTIFLFLSITIPSSNSLKCLVGSKRSNAHAETCKSYENKCKVHVAFKNKNSHEETTDKYSCASDNQGLGCYYAAGSQLTMECICNTDLCNVQKLDDDKLEECKYLKGKDDKAFTKVERDKEASKCYYKSSKNVETGGPMTEQAGIISSNECEQFGIPEEKTCKKTFQDIQGQWTELVLCCCEGKNCNDINPKDIQADSAPPLKCHSTDNKQYCHGTAGKQENAVCWYQAKLQANGNTTTEAAARCVDKSQCPILNPGDGGKCNVSMQDSDTITVDCCCKETECNTHEQMKSELAKITTLPIKCYVYSNDEAKVSKWCASNTCSYTLKKAQDSNDQISEEGSCKEDSEEKCDPENPCISDVSDEEGKAVITINCCCTKDNCNTQDSAELDQSIKDIKVPERVADTPQAAGAMSFSQLLATTIIGVSVLIAAVQHLHIGI